MAPKNYIDLTGRVFGRLTVTGREPVSKGWVTRWVCVCSCGKAKVVDGPHLARGTTNSCGCLRAERTSQRSKTHGLRDSKEYAVWNTMIQRCTNPNHSEYSAYKDRVPPERWFKFENFYADMGPRPGPGFTIERSDNTKGYGPDNCVWATMKANNRNRKDTKMITFNGVTRPLPEWAEVLGVRYGLLNLRLHRGWSVERAFKTPAQSIAVQE